eukprot:364774-Chlamydomonas_euryale.AAC.18
MPHAWPATSKKYHTAMGPGVCGCGRREAAGGSTLLGIQPMAAQQVCQRRPRVGRQDSARPQKPLTQETVINKATSAQRLTPLSC